MRREEARILREYKPELQRRFGVESIALFGSTARGEAGPDSDIDVLVEFSPDFEASLLDFIDLKHFLSDILAESVYVLETQFAGTPLISCPRTLASR